MARNDDMIVDLLKEVREDQKTHSIILVELQKDVSRNTEDLTEHIEGVQQNRKRIEKLEAPGKAFDVVKSYILGAGMIAGAVVGVLKLLAYF